MTVTVIEAAERILARVASKPLADHLTKLHEDNGVQVLTGIGVDSINAESGIFESVTLTSGEKIVGDMLITGIGVFPIVRWRQVQASKLTKRWGSYSRR